MKKIATTIKIVIVEDQELHRLKLEAFALALGYKVMATTDNSEEAIELITKEKPDIVIMDININGKLNGIEVAEKLGHLNVSFLFITSLKEKELYKKAKETSYIGYLIKPFDEVTVQSTIELAMNKQKNALYSNLNDSKSISNIVFDDSVFIKHNTQLYKIFVDDIIYIEAKGKLSIIHTKGKNLISNTSLTKFSVSLPQHLFVRVHKGYVINTNYITKLILRNNEIIIADTSLPIGRVYKEALLKRFDVF